MKRRVLSIALVLCMLCALIPASVAFAAEPTYAAADEQGNTKVVYGLIPSLWTEAVVGNTAYFKEVISPAYHSSTLRYPFSYSKPFSTAAITNTHGGFWRFHSGLDAYANTATIKWSKLSFAPYTGTSGNGPYNYYALAFTVPKDGYYNVTVAIKDGVPGAGDGLSDAVKGRFSYMIFDGNVATSTMYNGATNVKYNTDGTYTGTKGTHYLGVVSNLDDSKQLTDTYGDGEGETPLYLTKGEHIIAFHGVPTVGGSANYTGFALDYFMISQGNANVGAPMGEAETTVDRTELTVGEGTAQADYNVVGKLYNSATWGNYSIGTVTYESSNEDVATVDENGVITPVGKGTAEISALIDGFPLTPVTVNVAKGKNNTRVIYGTTPSILGANAAYGNTALFKQVISPLYHTSATQPAYSGNMPGSAALKSTHGGFWRFHSRFDQYGNSVINWSEVQFGPYAPANGNGPYNVYALAFTVPKDGYYNVTFAIKSGLPSKLASAAAGRFSYMIHDIDTAMSTMYNTASNVRWTNNAVSGTKGTHYLGVVSNIADDTGYSLVDTYGDEAGEEAIYLTKGEHIMAIHAVSGISTYTGFALDYFMISQGDADVGAPIGEAETTVDKTELTAGEDTAQAGYNAGTLYNSSTWGSYSIGAVTYASSDEDVATVDASGVITPVGKGTAEISAVIDGFPIAPVTVNVKVKESLGTTTKFLGIDIPSGSVSGAEGNGEIEDIAVGTKITLTKPADANFKYFRIGGVKNGKAITAASYTFTLVSPTCVTAVYDNPGDVKLELWGPNNTIIDVLGDGTNSFTPDLSGYAPIFAGYTFNGWKFNDGRVYNGEKVTNIKRVVADFTKDADQSVSGITVNGSATAATNNTAVTVNADSGIANFLRDGTIVYRGETYEHYPWTATAIVVDNSGSEGTLSPTALLTKHASRTTEFMLEYNTFGAEFVEAGIVFGATADVTLGAYWQKAATEKTDAHGQMTARSADATNAKYARGYLVYSDGENISVVYTDAQMIG